MKNLLKVLLMAGLLVSNLLKAQSQEGTIKGRVIDKSTQQALVGAVVSCISTQKAVETDTTGTFIITNVPIGNQPIIVNLIGYQSKKITELLVYRNKISTLEVELLEEIITKDEVKITAQRFENDRTAPVSAYSFSREEIFRNPGAQGDIFRAIGILPGVSSSGGQYSAISVRGQGTADNVYMVDDIPMTEVSHLEGNSAGFNDPNGGRFSIFAPRIIDNAQFQGGGFGAQYGRKSSSYLGLSIKEGNKENAFVSGQFDLLGFTLLYDGPSKFHKKTSVFASARYQHFGMLLKMLNLQQLGVPAYADYLVKTTTQINSKNKLSVIAMLNPENFDRGVESMKFDKKAENIDLPSGYTDKAMLALNLKTLIGKKSFLKNVAYYQYQDGNFNVGRAFPTLGSDGLVNNFATLPVEKNVRLLGLGQNVLGYRSIFTRHFKNVTSTSGVDLTRLTVRSYRNLSRMDTSYVLSGNDFKLSPEHKYAIVLPEYFNTNFNESANNVSLYSDLSISLHKLTLNPGLRYDYTGFTDFHSLSPRLSGSFQATEKNSFNFSTGLFYQDPLPTYIADNIQKGKLKNERVWTSIVGVRRNFSTDTKLIIEGWYKQFDNMISRTVAGTKLLTNNGTGYAYGTDINVTKRLSKKYYGQIGYSYMQTKRNDNDGKGEYDFIFSQPHMVSALASYQPTEKWTFSGKFRYATGRPKDEFIIHKDVFNNPSAPRYSQEITKKAGSRLNDFISIDLRADYKFQINKVSSTFFVDIVNILDRKNQNGELLQPVTGKVVYDGVGIFPTFGLRIEY